MTISLSDAGKRFNREWIFRRLNYTFSSGTSYAIVGPNGSGKSTLLQVLGGSTMLNEGTIQFSINGTTCPIEQIFNHVSICAPYLEVVEEMTALEFLRFHNAFKSFLPGIAVESAVEKVGLAGAANKQIRYYSSGMKQRIKLAQCIFSDTAIVLLDEPCTNLDAAGIALYHDLVRSFCGNRLVVVSSNDEVEYKFCSNRLEMGDYKRL